MLQSPADLQRRKRELRLRIGRLRRQIDRHAHAVQREGERLLSWRTVVRQLPGNAVLAAFGFGLALAAGLSARSMARWLGLRMMRRSLREGRRFVWAEWHRIWSASSPRPAAAEEAVGHD